MGFKMSNSIIYIPRIKQLPVLKNINSAIELFLRANFGTFLH